MKELSKKQTYQKVLIFLATFFSFILAYIVYGFGMFNAKGFFAIISNFLTIGAFFYIIFEAVITFAYTMYSRLVPNFCFGPKDFKMYVRVLFIFRNLAICLLNIIFIFFPVASIWGIKIVHIVTTIATAVVGLYFIRKDIQDQKYDYYSKTAILLLIYFVIYLFFGVIA